MTGRQVVARSRWSSHERYPAAVPLACRFVACDKPCITTICLCHLISTDRDRARRSTRKNRKGDPRQEFGQSRSSETYADNPARTPNQFVADITPRRCMPTRELGRIGWIGEPPFNFARRASAPISMLASGGGAQQEISWRGPSRCCAAHPIRVAEQWRRSTCERRPRRFRPARIDKRRIRIRHICRRHQGISRRARAGAAPCGRRRPI